MNCVCRHCHAAVIKKKCSDCEIFITKIYIQMIFLAISQDFLSHENSELYSIAIMFFMNIRCLLRRYVYVVGVSGFVA